MLLQTYHYRIKDSSGVAWLNAAAKAINYVWNYCNDTASHALKRDGKWLSGCILKMLREKDCFVLYLSVTLVKASWSAGTVSYDV